MPFFNLWLHNFCVFLFPVANNKAFHLKPHQKTLIIEYLEVSFIRRPRNKGTEDVGWSAGNWSLISILILTTVCWTWHRTRWCWIFCFWFILLTGNMDVKILEWFLLFIWILIHGQVSSLNGKHHREIPIILSIYITTQLRWNNVTCVLCWRIFSIHEDFRIKNDYSKTL